MLGTFKAGKRRAYQDVLHRLFKAEETTSDEEFEYALKQFKIYERDVQTLVKTFKDLIKQNQQLQSSAASVLSIVDFHLPKNGCNDADLNLRGQVPFPAVIEDNCNDIASVIEVSFPSYQHMQKVDIIEPLETLLLQDFPILRKRIVEHGGVRKDLESYRRRVRKMQQNGKDEGDKDMDKLTAKLKSTQENYLVMHSSLLHDLKTVLQQRQSVLEPVYMAYSVSQRGHLQYLMQALNLHLKRDEFDGKTLNERSENLQMRSIKEFDGIVKTLRANAQFDSMSVSQNQPSKLGKLAKLLPSLKKNRQPAAIELGHSQSGSTRHWSVSNNSFSHQSDDYNPNYNSPMLMENKPDVTGPKRERASTAQEFKSPTVPELDAKNQPRKLQTYQSDNSLPGAIPILGAKKDFMAMHNPQSFQVMQSKSNGVLKQVIEIESDSDIDTSGFVDREMIASVHDDDEHAEYNLDETLSTMNNTENEDDTGDLTFDKENDEDDDEPKAVQPKEAKGAAVRFK